MWLLVICNRISESQNSLKIKMWVLLISATVCLNLDFDLSSEELAGKWPTSQLPTLSKISTTILRTFKWDWHPVLHCCNVQHMYYHIINLIIKPLSISVCDGRTNCKKKWFMYLSCSATSDDNCWERDGIAVGESCLSYLIWVGQWQHA